MELSADTHAVMTHYLLCLLGSTASFCSQPAAMLADAPPPRATIVALCKVASRLQLAAVRAVRLGCRCIVRHAERLFLAFLLLVCFAPGVQAIWGIRAI